ncbi:MAG: family 43 glycosylhydrolase [Clostridia bacterium]|nr:family 43 glycosylhydrolase [Clostridia bacterium]
MLTYCNPLSVKDVKSGKWLDTDLSKQGLDCADYRSISDPSVIYHDGKWIMYPSYAVAYVSEDFVHWEHVDIGVPNLRYSPAVVEFRGKWYLSGHGMSEVYSSDSPLGPFTVCGHLTDVNGNILKVADGCYLADGDRLYFYYHDMIPTDLDVENMASTVGVELNPDKPWECITAPVVINKYDPTIYWQPKGEHNQNLRMGWIEGQWMKKIGSRYYLLYSANGTQYGKYANAVVYSDEGPLSGFVPQKRHTPLTRKPDGIMRGAGHGCIVDGPNNTLWIFYTCIFNFYHKFERRIGMDPIGIDENGELYCPEVTDTPQFAPGALENPEKGNSAGLLPLTFMERPTASSNAPGRDAIYACDDSILSWWQPAENDKAPEISFILGTATSYFVHSVRLMWRDIGMDTDNGIFPGPFKYVIEYAADAGQKDWKTLVDASENTDDLCIDYRQFEPVVAYAVRLRILSAPEGITPALVSLTAFGRCNCKISY